jgi:ABC-type taurine transport system ATPase subunit
LFPLLRAWSSNDGRLFGLRIIGTSDAARELIARADELGVGDDDAHRSTNRTGHVRQRHGVMQSRVRTIDARRHAN